MTTLTLSAGGHAFGDASHPTTALLLAALEGLAAQWQPSAMCDMGCGSGILSLRALQLWPALQVVAADLERSAVDAARENARANGVVVIEAFTHFSSTLTPPSPLVREREIEENPRPQGGRGQGEGEREASEGAITILHSDGFNHSEIKALAPYDLIVMNILAEPILRLLKDAEALLAEGGVLLLSGMLAWQQEPIMEASQALGLELGHRFSQGGWVAHLWQK